MHWREKECMRATAPKSNNPPLNPPLNSHLSYPRFLSFMEWTTTVSNHLRSPFFSSWSMKTLLRNAFALVCPWLINKFHLSQSNTYLPNCLYQSLLNRYWTERCASRTIANTNDAAHSQNQNKKCRLMNRYSLRYSNSSKNHWFSLLFLYHAKNVQ